MEKNIQILKTKILKSIKSDSLFELFWQIKPKTFQNWKEQLKADGVFLKIKYSMLNHGLKQNEQFDELYKELSQMISWNLFIGLKREQSAFYFLRNKNWDSITRARRISQKYDQQFEIDLFAEKERRLSAFQVKGPEAFNYSEEAKQRLLSSMIKIRKYLPVEKFFLVIIPNLKPDQKAHTAIHLHELKNDELTKELLLLQEAEKKQLQKIKEDDIELSELEKIKFD